MIPRNMPTAEKYILVGSKYPPRHLTRVNHGFCPTLRFAAEMRAFLSFHSLSPSLALGLFTSRTLVQDTRTACETNPSPVHCILGMKQPEREADFYRKSLYVRIHTSTFPCAFIVCCIIRHRDSFTFTLQYIYYP
jgi:hypothetical protein